MTDRKAKELGYIDVTFVNLTEQRERQERLYNVVRWTAIVLASIAGFLILPILMLLDNGDNVFVSLYEWGNVTLALIVLSTLAAAGFLAGLLTYYAVTKNR